MEVSHKAAVALAKSLKVSLAEKPATIEVVVCPSFPSLQAVSEVFAGSDKVAVGAQDVSVEEKGAYTGETSITQISSFATWCIVGHSERRAISGETDEVVVAKANLLLRHGLHPVVCLGETQEERSADQTIAKITRQLEVLIQNMPRTSLVQTVIAYEPIWAIGSGEMPEPDEVAEIMLLMRKILAERFDVQLSERIRILYGGSVKPDTVAPYVGGPYADGVLVGGASVHAGQFVDIVKHVAEKY